MKTWAKGYIRTMNVSYEDWDKAKRRIGKCKNIDAVVFNPLLGVATIWAITR